MFKKKSPEPSGRKRPATGGAQHNAAVFSYRSATRPAEPQPVRGRNIRQADTENVSGAAKTRRTRKDSWLKRGPRLLLLIMGVLLLVLNIFLGTSPHIKTATHNGTNQVYLRDQATYEAAARQLLAGSVFNRTKPTINAGRLTAKLRTQFPELADIRVTVPLVGMEPTVVIEPATPVLLLSSGGTVYALDAAGKALITTNQVPGLAKLQLPLVGDQSGLLVTPGHVALPGSSVAFITEVVGQLKAKKIAVSALTLPKGTSELDIRVSGVSYIVKFNIRGNARVEAGTYLAVKQQLEHSGTTPGNYIDVRVEGHAYYK